MSTTTISPPQRYPRYGQTIRLRPECAQAYMNLHASTWPAILARITASNIHDYSIFYEEDSSTLFATFVYTGTDFAADMEAMAMDPETRKWWEITDGMQESLVKGATGSKDGVWWKQMKEVFYHA